MNALWVGFGEKNIKIVMTCKCLTSDWLTALSITVINPIKLPERRERETRGTETQRQTRQRQRQRQRERERERPRLPSSLTGTTALPRLPPCPVNEWMNGPGTTVTATRATRTPRKQIARRGLIRPIYFVFEMQRSFRGDFAQSSWNSTTARGRRKTGYETKLDIYFSCYRPCLIVLCWLLNC